MTKGSLKHIFTCQTTHRIPKIATLALTTSMLVTMIAIDASASPNGSLPTSVPGVATISAKSTSVFASESSLKLLFNQGRRRTGRPDQNQPTTTTTAAPTTVGSTVTSGGSGGGGGAAGTPTSTSTTTTTTTSPVSTTTTPVTTTTAPAQTAYPVGVADSSQPSGFDPPTANALPGYSQAYVTDFPGNSLPAGWDAYSGTPAGDPGGQYGAAHAVVGGGMLSLNTWQDPAYNNEWVTGGVCDCGVSPTYGAFFVRSRVTGPGPTNVEILYPNSGWPPEVDFNETTGTTNASMATIHWGSSNSQYHSYENTDLTQWHTWGVIWTPTTITYTIDGKVWSTVTSSEATIPNVPMHLTLQQQTWCGASPAYACPTSPQSMQINWVAIYTPNS
jgi:hypothetical protein